MERKFYRFIQQRSEGRYYHISESRVNRNCSLKRNKLAPVMFIEAEDWDAAWGIKRELDEKKSTTRFGDKWDAEKEPYSLDKARDILSEFPYPASNFTNGVRASIIVFSDGTTEELTKDDLNRMNKEKADKEKQDRMVLGFEISYKSIYPEDTRVVATINVSTWKVEVSAKYDEEYSLKDIKMVKVGPDSEIDYRDRRGNNPNKPFREVRVYDRKEFFFNEADEDCIINAFEIGKEKVQELLSSIFNKALLESSQNAYLERVRRHGVRKEVEEQRNKLNDDIRKALGKDLDPMDGKLLSRVKFYNSDKGFGFISRSLERAAPASYPSKDIFFHISNCGDYIPEENDSVLFEIDENEKGIFAKNIYKENFINDHIERGKEGVKILNKFLDDYPAPISLDDKVKFNVFLGCIDYALTSNQTFLSAPVGKGSYNNFKADLIKYPEYHELVKRVKNLKETYKDGE